MICVASGVQKKKSYIICIERYFQFIHDILLVVVCPVRRSRYLYPEDDGRGGSGLFFKLIKINIFELEIFFNIYDAYIEGRYLFR